MCSNECLGRVCRRDLDSHIGGAETILRLIAMFKANTVAGTQPVVAIPVQSVGSGGGASSSNASSAHTMSSAPTATTSAAASRLDSTHDLLVPKEERVWSKRPYDGSGSAQGRTRQTAFDITDLMNDDVGATSSSSATSSSHSVSCSSAARVKEMGDSSDTQHHNVKNEERKVKQVMSNGFYTGAVNSFGIKHGHGLMAYTGALTGTTYVGNWKNGRMYGKGEVARMTSKNQLRVVMCGVGKCTYPDSSFFEGEFEQGQRKEGEFTNKHGVTKHVKFQIGEKMVEE
eukprot:gene30469-37689_t